MKKRPKAKPKGKGKRRIWRTRGKDIVQRRMNPKSLANLKPIAPGEVRNPLGINRGRIYSDRYEEMASGILPERIRRQLNREAGEQVLAPGSTWAQGNALRRHLNAVRGGVPAEAKEMREAVEGKARQRLEVTGAEGKDLIPAGSLESLTLEELRARRQKLEEVLRRANERKDKKPEE